MSYWMHRLAPRQAFAISLVFAAASLPFNVVVQLYTWSAFAKITGPAFADTNHGLVLVCALMVHLGLYVGLLFLALSCFRGRFDQKPAVALLGAGILYSALVLGACFIWAGFGNLP